MIYRGIHKNCWRSDLIREVIVTEYVMESVRIMKKIISNLSIIIFIIGCMTVEISTWLTYENAYVIFYSHSDFGNYCNDYTGKIEKSD